MAERLPGEVRCTPPSRLPSRPCLCARGPRLSRSLQSRVISSRGAPVGRGGHSTVNPRALEVVEGDRGPVWLLGRQEREGAYKLSCSLTLY